MKKRLSAVLFVLLFGAMAVGIAMHSHPKPAEAAPAPSDTLAEQSFGIWRKTARSGTKTAVYDSETSVVIGVYHGLHYTITEIQKDADGHLLPAAVTVYRGQYTPIQ